MSNTIPSLPDTPLRSTHTPSPTRPQAVFGPFTNLGRALEWTLSLQEEQLWDIEPLRSPQRRC